MSAEAQLGRIADALEALLELQGGTVEKTQGGTATAGDPLAPPATEGKAGAVRKPRAAAGSAAPTPAPAPTPNPTYDDVVDKLRDLVTAKTHPVAKGILAEFGAAKVSDVKPEQYAALFTRMDAELKAKK